MKQYLLSVMQPDGEPPEAPVLEEIGRRLRALHAELHEAGAWVFSNGLFPADVATVVTPTGDDVLITDGPYLEGKEHLGGLSIVNAPDLDAALEWGRKLALATTLPIEVRPFHDQG